MRVKMKTVSTGPKGNRELGVEYDIADEAEAKALVDGGFADEVKPVAPAKAEVEVATKPEPENAATRVKPPRKRRKG